MFTCGGIQTTKTSSNSIINGIFAILFFVAIWLFIQSYMGHMNDDVIFNNYAFKQNDHGNTDYQIWVDYSSKGAFIAGEKINVEAKLNLKNDTFKDSKFIIAFPNSIPENALTKNDYPFIPNAQIDLLFFDNQNASGSTDMIYSMPGEYEYTLIVDGVPQYQLINVNQKIHIAPLETRLQVKNNDRILGLTWLIIAMMIFQIKREFENLITRLRPVLSKVYDKVAGILK